MPGGAQTVYIPKQELGNEKAGAWERESRSLGTRKQELGNEKTYIFHFHI
jgi:hypothetical protein